MKQDAILFVLSKDRMRITLTGATGSIGSPLVRRLLAGGHSLRLLGRRKPGGLPPPVEFTLWPSLQEEAPTDALRDADAVVHLAGEPVAQRWTPEVKQRIRRSRVDGTLNLIRALTNLTRRPSVFVCASAIGIYGSRGDEILTESSAAGSGFLAETVVEWEQTADLAAALGLRAVKIRTGIVLEKNGGALQKMLPPFRLGVGGPVGSGRQWMSWIHIDDIVGLYVFALENASLRGTVNGTAPNPVTNADFTRALGSALRRPAILPVPAFAVKLMFGEMGEIVLGSQRVLPNVAENAGYQFQYPTLAPAFANVLE